MPPIPMAPVSSFPSLVAVSPLLTVLRFLTGRTAAVSPSDILFLLGFGFHLPVVLRFVASTSEVDAVLENLLKIVHINDGKVLRR